MYFSKETLAANSRLGGHWNELWANRNMWNANHNAMITANRAHMTQEWLAVNAVGGFSRDFGLRSTVRYCNCVTKKLAWKSSTIWSVCRQCYQ